MPDIFYLLSKWWKQVFGLVLLSIAIAAAIVFVQPRKYLSVATALPASSSLADKSRIFNDNLENLYSALGNPDDLDRIMGTAQLDTIYLAIADEFNLWDHYKLDEKETYRYKSAKILKRNSSVIKSEFGELKVKVWDTDKNLAPQLANAILARLNQVHQGLQNEMNLATLHSLKQTQAILQSRLDSAGNNNGSLTTLLAEQLRQYEKLIGEYQLMLDNKPAVLMVVENARASLRADKPDRLMILSAVLVGSFVFGLLLALVLERRKTAAT